VADQPDETLETFDEFSETHQRHEDDEAPRDRRPSVLVGTTPYTAQ